MKKTLIYSLLVIGVFGLVGVGLASTQGWFGFDAQKKELMLQQKADFLGISIDELKSALEQGMSYEEIIEEYELDINELKAHMMEMKHNKMGDWKDKKGIHKGFGAHLSK